MLFFALIFSLLFLVLRSLCLNEVTEAKTNNQELNLLSPLITTRATHTSAVLSTNILQIPSQITRYLITTDTETETAEDTPVDYASSNTTTYEEITYEPTLDPTSEPIIEQVLAPTLEYTFGSTFEPTSQPTIHPSLNPTHEPTYEPTYQPTFEPTYAPTPEPSLEPTAAPVGSNDGIYSGSAFTIDSPKKAGLLALIIVSIIFSLSIIALLSQIYCIIYERVKTKEEEPEPLAGRGDEEAPLYA